MTPPAAIIDTNVVVAGLLARDLDSPTARILGGMLDGGLRCLLTVAVLLAEYRTVLLRPRIANRHGLDEDEIDRILEELTLNAAVRETAHHAPAAPDPDDQHLWDLLASEPDAVLVTGDRMLLGARAPAGRSILSPVSYLALTGAA